MADVYVRAELAAELPGGVPDVLHMVKDTGRGTWMVVGGRWRDEAWLPPGLPLVDLPGPDNLNAAGLLVRLAQSVGAEVEPVPSPDPLRFVIPQWYLWENLPDDPDHPSHEPATWWIDWSDAPNCTQGFRYADIPGWNREGLIIVPTLAGVTDPMAALAAVVEWAGLLFGVARLVGLELAPGEWPTLEQQGNGNHTWWLGPSGSGRSVYNTRGEPNPNDPATALRAVWAHLREVT